MNDPLIAFLIKLDKDDALKQEYLNNPEDVARSFNLGEEDVAICVNNDIDAMKSRAEAEGADVINISHAG